VLTFFAARLGELPIALDRRLEDLGVVSRDGVRLGPAAYGQPCEASVLAHELFHLWCRSRVSVDEWRALTCLVPHGRNGGVEQIAADLLAQQLFARAGMRFHPLYLADDLPEDLLARRLRDARSAAAAALLSPQSVEALLSARAALSLLSGFELAALALLEAGLPRPQVSWPEPLGREVAELRALLGKLLPAIAGPQLLRGLCRLFARRRWGDRRRGPLWQGDSPLELPGQLLQQRARARGKDLRASAVAHLESVRARLAAL
jgi:hypothetical protein